MCIHETPDFYKALGTKRLHYQLDNSNHGFLGGVNVVVKRQLRSQQAYVDTIFQYSQNLDLDVEEFLKEQQLTKYFYSIIQTLKDSLGDNFNNFELAIDESTDPELIESNLEFKVQTNLPPKEVIKVHKLFYKLLRNKLPFEKVKLILLSFEPTH